MKPCSKIWMLVVTLVVASQALAVSSSEASKCVLGDQALAQKQPDLAVIQYNECLSKNAPTFKILSNLGIAYAQQEQFPQAIQAYLQALALESDNPIVRVNLGLAYMKTSRPKEAAQQFARSLMADPDNAKTLELLAYSHFAMGDYALAAYEEGLVNRAKPDDHSSEYILGSCYLRLGMFTRAIPLIYDSVSQSKSPDAYMVLGEALLGMKAYGRALETFQKALSLNPNTPGIYSDISLAYQGLGKPDKAMAALKQELARDPNDFTANYLLGHTDRLDGDDVDALKYLDKANKIDPGDTSVDYEYAVLAIKHQDYAKAESILRGILQKMPSYTDAHVLLAEVYFRLHNTEEGMREKAIVAALRKSEQARNEAEAEAPSRKSFGKNATPARPDP